MIVRVTVMKKHKLFLLCLILGGVFLIRPASAYLRAQEQRQNHITIGENEIRIQEKFQKPSSWLFSTTYDKEVRIQNTGSVPCYMRVFAEVSNADIPAQLDLNTTAWKKGKDGYYYYKDIVAPKQKTAVLFQHVQIAEADIKQEAFQIIVYAESVQAQGYQDAEAAFSDIA